MIDDFAKKYLLDDPRHAREVVLGKFESAAQLVR
jgi:hypothetical protein